MSNNLKIVEPHQLISRPVAEEDMRKVYEDANSMHKLLFRPIGMYRSFYALAHQQCDNQDPLRFFVLQEIDKEQGIETLVVINPVITRHTNQEIESSEGCASFANLPKAVVKRFNKCEVEYNEISFIKVGDDSYEPVIGARKTAKLSGKMAKIFQHECDHLDAKYIY